MSGREEEGDVEEKKKNGERRGRVAFKSPSQPPLPWSRSFLSRATAIRRRRMQFPFIRRSRHI